MNKYDSISYNKTQLNAKFDFLYSKLMRSHARKFPIYHKMEKTIQTRFSQLLSRINKKAEEKCGKEMEEIKFYSLDLEINQLKLKNFDEKSLEENLKNFRIRPGNEREFKEAFKNLTTCTNNFFEISEELEDKFKKISDLTKNSNEFCIEECKRDVLEFHKTESETTECLESCWRYKKLNMETSFNLSKILLESKEKVLQNL